jgi:hypothetical protein
MLAILGEIFMQLFQMSALEPAGQGIIKRFQVGMNHVQLFGFHRFFPSLFFRQWVSLKNFLNWYAQTNGFHVEYVPAYATGASEAFETPDAILQVNSRRAFFVSVLVVFLGKAMALVTLGKYRAHCFQLVN